MRRLGMALLVVGLLAIAGCGKKAGGGGKCGEYFRRLKQNFSQKVTDDKKGAFMAACEQLPKDMLDCIVSDKVVLSDECRAKVDFQKRNAVEKIAGAD